MRLSGMPEIMRAQPELEIELTFVFPNSNLSLRPNVRTVPK